MTSPWTTACEGCGRWVDSVLHVTLEGKRICRDCCLDQKIEIGPPKKRVLVLGPPAPEGAVCRCGQPAQAQCQGCGGSFCAQCWHRHSHRVPDPFAWMGGGL